MSIEEIIKEVTENNIEETEENTKQYFENSFGPVRMNMISFD